MPVITKALPETGIWKPVLDNGYVRIPTENDKPLILGSDLTVVNSARTSFLKESEEFTNADEKLLKFLWNRKETEPFRHCFMSFEIKAPLMVCRQHWRYAVGSNHGEFSTAWSEASKRYVTMKPEFYMIPDDQWRSAPDNKKQGSGSPVPTVIGGAFSSHLIEYIDRGIELYENAMANNIAPELARLFLPANGMYTVYRWSCSLGALCHFLRERLEDKAQYEIREYAIAVKNLIQPFFPITMEALLGD